MTDDADGTVLIVDDNKPIADTYAAFIQDRYDVETVYDGESALETIDPTVDVVLLDRRMPGLSGDEVLAEIGTRALDCRVVMLTAVDPEFDIVDMAFDAYVVKPVERSDVTAIVEEMMDRAQYDDALRQFLALSSKKAALEQEKKSAELASSEEYERIEARLAEMRSDIGIDTEDLEAIFDGTVSDITSGGIPSGSTSK